MLQRTKKLSYSPASHSRTSTLAAGAQHWAVWEGADVAVGRYVSCQGAGRSRPHRRAPAVRVRTRTVPTVSKGRSYI